MRTGICSELIRFVAPEFVFGIGARKQTGTCVKNLGINQVLLVTDPGIIEKGWTGEIQQSLSNSGINSILFSNVSANPRDSEVMAGVEQYLSGNCNGIVAVGGGSPIDCAKGIAIVVANSGNILDYEGVDMIAEPGPPLVCVPTTSGSAADVSQFAIILDTKKKTKIAIISKAIIPNISLIDPEVTITKDPFLTACTGLDVLSHAVEAACSNASSPVTDLHALAAAKLVSENLVTAVKHPDNLMARYNMSLASLEAGLAFSNTSLGAVHAMSHSLGGLLDLPHGECNAILLPYVVKYNFPEAIDRFKNIAKAMGIQVEELTDKEVLDKLVCKITQIKEEAGITISLKDAGVKPEDLMNLAEKAVDDPCLLTNPRKADTKALEKIYREAV